MDRRRATSRCRGRGRSRSAPPRSTGRNPCRGASAERAARSLPCPACRCPTARPPAGAREAARPSLQWRRARAPRRPRRRAHRSDRASPASGSPGPPRAASRPRSRLRQELERDRVPAVAGVLRREPLADEDVAEVSAARGALDLDTLTVRIRDPVDGAFDLLIERRPPAAGVELRVRNVERRVAPPADVGALREEVVVRAGEWTFGALVHDHACLFRGELVHVAVHLRTGRRSPHRPGRCGVGTVKVVGARRLALASVLALACACSATPAAVPSWSPTSLAAASPAPATATPSRSPTPTPSTTSPTASPSPTPAPTPAPTAATTIPQVRLVRAMGGLAFNSMTGAFPGPDGRWYVLEQPGRILTFREGDATATVFLDIRDHVEFGGEKGLLGFAFAPDFARSGVFFLDYTRGGPLRTEIASFTSSGALADKATEVVILEIAQPFDIHNCGQHAFGPDGYLYIAMGDGGSGGDPMRNGQNKNVLLAKLLRIDVGDRTRYRVPSDNPFAAGGGRGEIWAYGLRNPWRFSFDTETGALWLGDVGQDQYEEIDLISRGANYGWNIMEATHCYNASRCDMTALTFPIFEYPHSLGCSVTGGFVDRGSTDLRGVYLYGDYCSGRIWGLRYEGGQVTGPTQVATSGFPIGSFAQDRSGAVYVLQYGSSGGIYKITR